MEAVLQVFLVLTLVGFALIFLLNRKKKSNSNLTIPDKCTNILAAQVPFYQQLDEINKKEFENRVKKFLLCVKITGVKTTAQDLDKVLIAASAIIPIFNFHNWEYCNLNEGYYTLTLLITSFSRKALIVRLSAWWVTAH